MAIDDNTVYGLTGAQVKELPGKIEAVKGLARELTADDYNWPASNPNGVAQWLLPEGIYSCDSTTNVYPDASSSAVNRALFFKFTQVYHSWMIYFDHDDKRWRYWSAHKDTGARNTFGAITPAVIDNLTSTSGTSALSANQGKVLKDLIDSIAIRGAGAPTTSTVGEVGQLYEDGTNGALYQLKSIDITTTPNTYNWEQVGGSSVNVVQTTGTSTADVMSQRATTSMMFSDPATQENIHIGGGGGSSSASGVAIGYGSSATAFGAIAIGREASSGTNGLMSIGSSSTTYGYNNSNYRLLTGLYDGQSAHDAATVAQGNTLSASAPTTATEGVLGQLWTDTTNMHTYQCTAISGDTFTWTQRW